MGLLLLAVRYAQGGGLTPAEQRQRELVRLEAAARFDRGESNSQVARVLRVGERRVEKWRKAYREGGVQALWSTGPLSRPKLDDESFARLEIEMRRGPAAHGWDVDQRWTLARVQSLIQEMFTVSYTLCGVSKLLRRHGWSLQVPVARATERDEDAIQAWKDQVWPEVKRPRRPRGPGSVSRTRQVRD